MGEKSKLGDIAARKKYVLKSIFGHLHHLFPEISDSIKDSKELFRSWEDRCGKRGQERRSDDLERQVIFAEHETKFSKTDDGKVCPLSPSASSIRRATNRRTWRPLPKEFGGRGTKEGRPERQDKIFFLFFFSPSSPRVPKFCVMGHGESRSVHSASGSHSSEMLSQSAEPMYGGIGSGGGISQEWGSGVEGGGRGISSPKYVFSLCHMRWREEWGGRRKKSVRKKKKTNTWNGNVFVRWRRRKKKRKRSLVQFSPLSHPSSLSLSIPPRESCHTPSGTFFSLPLSFLPMTAFLHGRVGMEERGSDG